MKKFFILLLSVIFAVFCAGCVTVSPPITTDEGVSGNNPNNQNPGNTPGVDPSDTDNEARKQVFTVEITLEGAPFTPDDSINAVWTGENELHTAKFGETGRSSVASVTGLDGKYVVSLTGLPDKYTYDPNGNYNVSNTNRDTKIDLREIRTIPGNKSGDIVDDLRPDKNYWDNVIDLPGTGYYRITLKEPESILGYRFHPTMKGQYRIESFVDCKTDEVNPILDYYNGNFSAVFLEPKTTCNTGGKSGKYTRNFIFDCQKSGDAEDPYFWFAIHATAKCEFPVTVDFAVTYLDPPDNEYTTIKAKGRFNKERTLDQSFGRTWHYIYEGTNILDESKVKFKEDEGYYHLYYKDSSGNDHWGPTLYVLLNGNTVDPAKLPLWSSTYKIFKNYTDFIATYNSYLVQTRHPVNEELKLFLSDFAKTWDLFNDGHGSQDSGTGALSSGPNDIWLFSCGYYGDFEFPE